MQVCEPTVPWFGGQQQAHPHCRPQPAVAAQICNTQQLTHQLSNFPSFASNKVVKKMGQQLLSAPGTSHFAEVDVTFPGFDKTKNAWAVLVDLNRQSTYVSGMCHVCTYICHRMQHTIVWVHIPCQQHKKQHTANAMDLYLTAN